MCEQEISCIPLQVANQTGRCIMYYIYGAKANLFIHFCAECVSVKWLQYLLDFNI